MSYRCLTHQQFELDHYTLVPIREEDMEAVRVWRNSQLRYLRQEELLTVEQQKNYYHTVLEPSFGEKEPRQVLMSLLYRGVCIGYGGIVHIHWIDRRGEVSFLVATERSLNSEVYTRDFVHFLCLIKRVGFEDLHLHRLQTETYAIRPVLHTQILESQGFVLEGRMKEHVRIEGQFVDTVIHGCVDGTKRMEK